MIDPRVFPPFEATPRACPRCGWVALLRADRCPDCRDIQLDTLVNRAFCDLLHRDSPARAADRLDELDAAWPEAA
jgi:hypothetical protein